MNLHNLIGDGFDLLNLSLNDKQLERLTQYVCLLEKWNKAYNLSAIKTPEAIAKRHVLDSACMIKPWQSKGCDSIIDVGTGAGLPGLILAIIEPDQPVSLLDSNGKKTRFLFQAVTELGLKRVQIINQRVEAFQPDEKFAIVISRAYASLSDMIESTRHLLKHTGHWWAMKGVYPADEIAGLPSYAKLLACEPLTPPYCDEQRHLVSIQLNNTSNL